MMKLHELLRVGCRIFQISWHSQIRDELDQNKFADADFKLQMLSWMLS